MGPLRTNPLGGCHVRRQLARTSARTMDGTRPPPIHGCPGYAPRNPSGPCLDSVDGPCRGNRQVAQPTGNEPFRLRAREFPTPGEASHDLARAPRLPSAPICCVIGRRSGQTRWAPGRNERQRAKSRLTTDTNTFDNAEATAGTGSPSPVG